MAGKFEYVPASITTSTADSYLAAKFRDNSKDKNLWGRSRFNSVSTDIYPDRTLYTGRSTSNRSGILVEDVDAFIGSGLSTQYQVLRDMGYGFAMVSPHNVGTTTKSRRNPYVKLVSDSGGFQMHSGASDFIDPIELAQYYNETVDFGVGLDIPVFNNTELQDRMVEIMIKNNHIIKKHLLPEVSLYDVSHGATLAERQKFLNRVLKEKPSSDRLAVGGIAQNNRNGGALVTAVTGVMNLMYVLDRTKGRYTSFHILGTTAPFYLVLYEVLVSLLDVHLTADSTSYILSPTNNIYMYADTDPESIRFSSLQLPKDEMSFDLNCTCPACYLTKYPLHYVRHAHVNAIHALHAVKNIQAQVKELVSAYFSGERTLNDLARLTTGSNSSTLSVYEAVLEFAIYSAKQGFKAAYEKYYPTLRPYVRGAVKRAALFGNTNTAPTPEQEVSKARLLSIFDAYDKYHKKHFNNRKVKAVAEDDPRYTSLRVANLMGYPSYSKGLRKWAKKRGVKVYYGTPELLAAPRKELEDAKLRKVLIASPSLLLGMEVPLLGFTYFNGIYVNTRKLVWETSKLKEYEVRANLLTPSPKFEKAMQRAPDKLTYLQSFEKGSLDYKKLRRMFCNYLPPTVGAEVVTGAVLEQNDEQEEENE